MISTLTVLATIYSAGFLYYSIDSWVFLLRKRDEDPDFEKAMEKFEAKEGPVEPKFRAKLIVFARMIVPVISFVLSLIVGLCWPVIFVMQSVSFPHRWKKRRIAKAKAENGSGNDSEPA